MQKKQKHQPNPKATPLKLAAKQEQRARKLIESKLRDWQWVKAEVERSGK